MFQIGCLFFAFTSLVFTDWVLDENKALALSAESNLPILAIFLAEEGCCLEKYAQLLQEKCSHHPYVLEFKKRCYKEIKPIN